MLVTLLTRGKTDNWLPWRVLISNGLKVLRSALPSQLGHLPCPSVSPETPAEWCALVDLYMTYEEDTMVSKSVNTRCNVGEHTFRCDVSDFAASNAKSLSVHRWAKHKRTCNIRKYVGSTFVCSVCGVDVRCRARLIKHLSETRTRSKIRTTPCRIAFLEQLPPLVDCEVFDRLEKADKLLMKEARRNGHLRVIALTPDLKCAKRMAAPCFTSNAVQRKRRRLTFKQAAPDWYT